jgi:ADP-glucose pyrophosphorylase
MSAIEIKLRTSTGTHSLDEMSQWHVSKLNQAQNINWHSQSEQDVTVACQQLRSRSADQLALTLWMACHSGMSAIEIKVSRSTGTHSLDGMPQWHVSN